MPDTQAEIRVAFMGEGQIFLNGTPLVFPYMKVKLLLFMLLEARSATREQLCARIWGDYPATARQNLRNALTALRRLLPGGCVAADRRTVRIDERCRVVSDLGEPAEDAFSMSSMPFLGGLTQAGVRCEWIDERREHYRKKFLRLMRREDESDSAEERHSPNRPGLTESAELFGEFGGRGGLGGRGKNVAGNSRPPSALFVRVEERDGILAFLGEAREPGSETLCSVVLGEEGSGKSVLAGEVFARKKEGNAICLRGRCREDKGGDHRVPWEGILKTMTGGGPLFDLGLSAFHLRYLTSCFPEFRSEEEVFSHSYSQPRSPSAAMLMDFNPHLLGKIFALLFDEIHRRTRRQVFLLLEDIHWADRLIPDILRGLFENARRGFAVLLTCYPEFRPRLDIALELPGLRLREISLDRLSLEQTALICREVVSKDRLTPSRLAEIYEHTGGSPFLLQEFLRFCDAEDWSDKLAKSLHEVVNRRILSLSDEEANLLDCVAIFSGEASFDALKYLSELDDARLIRLYEKLHRKGLLYDRPDGESFAVLFRYPLIKKQIVSAMLGVKRWNLHRRLTGYLRRYVTQHGSPACLDERKLSLLAWHARQAGDSLTELDARIRELKAHFVFTHELFPMLSDADLTRPPKLTTDIGFIEARLREIRSLLDRVVRASGRPPGFHAFERAILTIEGGRLRWSGDYAGAQSCLDEALKLAHFSAEGEAAAVEVLEQFCYLGIQKDDPVLLRQYVFLFYRAAMRAHMSPQVGMALRFLAVLAIMEGRCDDAVKVLNMSIRLFEKLEARGDGYTLSIIAAIHYHGDVAVHRGNHEEALSHYRQCVKLCESRGFYRGLGLHLAKSAWCAARLGKVDRMREYLAFARPLFEGLQSRPGAGMCGGEIVLDLSALLDVLDGELERAAQYLRQAGDLSRIMHKPLWNAIHFCILALLKEREEPVLAPVLTEDTRHYLGEARTRFERLGLLHELEAFDQLRELMRGRQESQCL